MSKLHNIEKPYQIQEALFGEGDEKSPEEILMGLKQMAMGDLERISDYANMILERLNKGEELSSWMYSQITLAVDQLNSVHDSLDGKDGVKESINEASMPPVRKVVNAILKKYGVVPMKTTSTSVRGFHNIDRGGYRYEGNYFLGFYGVPQDIIDKVGDEMKKAGVKDVDVRKGIISADFTKTGLKESVNEAEFGEKIQKLNNRITKLRGDLARATTDNQKNVLQARLKNALQSLSDTKKSLSIKAPHTESVNEVGTSDWHFKAIKQLWDKSSAFTRKKIAALITKNPNSIWDRIAKELGASDYDDVSYYTDMLHLESKDGLERVAQGLPQTEEEPINEWKAEEVLHQLGGRRFIAMTGAKNFVKNDPKKQITFKIGGGAKGGINYVRITLTSMDLYNIEFLKARGTDLKVVAIEKGVYNDQLQQMFTKHTGMHTRL